MTTLSETKKGLEDFLCKNPYLPEQQNRIDEILESTHPDKRLEVLFIMMKVKTI